MGGNILTNFYWPVYKNLENEIIDLSYQVHICEEQLEVYSVKCMDLLFRISAEIESLIKDLYRKEIKNEPKNPGSALSALNTLWSLEEKQVIVSASNIFFKETQNKTFAPFSYSVGDKNDYYTAYNAVKHDRVKNINKASIRILIRAMAALYVLNVYYKNEKFISRSEGQINSDFNSSLGSELFSVKLAHSHINFLNQKKSSGMDKGIVDCIYITCYPKNIHEKLNKLQNETNKKIHEALTKSVEFNEFIESGGTFSPHELNFLSIAEKIGNWAFKKRILKYPSKEEQLKAIFNSSEYNGFMQNNSKLLEKVNKDDVNALCNFIGSWEYRKKTIIQFEQKRMSAFFNTTIEMVLNIGQTIYSEEAPPDILNK